MNQIQRSCPVNHCSSQIRLTGAAGVSLSSHRVRGRNTPWTGHQSVTRHTPLTHTLAESSIKLLEWGKNPESKQGPSCYDTCTKAAGLHKEAAAVGKSFHKTNLTSEIPAPFNAVRVTIIGRPSTVWAELMVCRSRLDWIFNWQRQPLFAEATSWSPKRPPLQTIHIIHIC